MKFNRKNLFFLLKIIVSVVLLYLVFRRIDFKELITVVSEYKLSVVLILILTSSVKLYSQYYNWKCLLRVDNSYVKNKYEAFKTHLIGLSLRFLIPGTQAAFGKVFFLNHSKKRSAILIFFELFFLTWKTLIFALFASFYFFPQIHFAVKLSAFVLCALAPFILYLIIRLKFLKIDDMAINFLRIIPNITISHMIFVLLTFIQYYVILNQFAEISFWNVFLSVSLIMASNTIPVSYSGLGFREVFAVYFFKHLSISPEISVTAALTIFFFNAFLPAIPGLYLVLFKMRSKKSK